MQKNFQYVLYTFFILAAIALPQNSWGQLVNMEETWQEFLRNQKASNVSELVKPERSQPANYLKYSLMYANTYFCADNIPEADKMMREITTIDDAVQDRIPGYRDRLALMKKKIKAYKDLAPVWSRFINDKYSVTRSMVEAVPEAKKVCEKGTLAKYFYLTAHAYYCEANLEQARNNFENRVLKLAKTSFNPDDVQGLSEEIEAMKKLWAGIDAVNPAWEAYMQTDVSPGFDTEIPVFDCYTVPNIKACLLRAAADFCGTGDEMLQKIRSLQKGMKHAVPAEVAKKITWLEDMVNSNNTDLEKLNQYWNNYTAGGKFPKKGSYDHVFVCDRAAEVKAYLLDGLRAPCVDGQMALDSIDRIKRQHQPSLDGTTSSNLKKLKNLVENELQATAALDEAWKDFLPDDKLSKPAEFGYEYCENSALAKAYVMDGIMNSCEKGKKRLADLKALKAKHGADWEADLQGKIDQLQATVDKRSKETADLNKAWAHLQKTDEVDEDLPYTYEFVCNRALEVQAYLLDGYTNPCQSGKYALEQVAKVQKEHNPTLDAATTKRLEELKDRVKNEGQNLAKLNATWKEFVPDNKIKGQLDIVFEYCDKIAQARSYIIDGTVNFCEKGKKRLADIYKLQEDYLLTLDDETLDKLNELDSKVKQAAKDLADLDLAWELYTQTDTETEWLEGFPSKDSMVRDQIRLVDFYCDPIAQTKSWAIKGLLDPCDLGDGFLQQIQQLKKEKSLSYDEALACQVRRLTNKVYQCKYWALVLKARKITHQERETFGPASSLVMYDVLNSDKQPCETTVNYEPLGYIGVRYIVAPSLCQKTNLAKMGDPEYYKKIASFVDQEVLSKYCEASMRCKEDFFIYLEGHTDGYRFSGAKYDKSLDIPEGTPYTHFLGNKNGTVDTLEKKTRHITRELKSNMELGIARAWTVKQQLDFMGVPITVGAYEHPENEKGGEYRKIDIELNITNLLLDFYEKTLNRLVKESGIGKRPGKC
ncbi:MAG: hypothetical protein AB8E82_01020 [Aureispira sp.]